jgi:ribosomal protein S18 acetylase RimI-like enzyme
MNVALRPAGPDDQDLMARIYASTRADELRAAPFTDDQRAAFLAHQFAAQRAHFAQHYPDASFDVIEVDGDAAGRLIVWRGKGVIDVVDIALLPDYRSRGIGTELMRAVLDEADATGARIVLHVESFNPARGLYERLGFKPVDTVGVYTKMERASAEDGFVRDAGFVAPDRDEKQVEPSQAGMVEPVDLLGEHGVRRSFERERKGRASAGGIDGVRPGRVGGGVEQLEVQPKGVGMQNEHVSDQRSKAVDVQAVEHTPDGNRGFTRRRALQIGAVTALTAMWAGPSLARAATNSTPVYLRRASYTSLGGSTFTIDGGSFSLASIADLAGAAEDAALRGHDEAFVLEFDGQAGALTSGIHNFSHPDLGSYSMFASPVGDANGGSQRYEVVVDRSVGRPADPPEPAAPAPPAMTDADKEAAAAELRATTSVHDIPGAPKPSRKRVVKRKHRAKRKHRSKHHAKRVKAKHVKKPSRPRKPVHRTRRK